MQRAETSQFVLGQIQHHRRPAPVVDLRIGHDTMRVLRAILLLTAFVYGVSFALNMQSFGWSSDDGFQAEGYHGWTRLEPLLIFSFCGLWYYGLRTRRLWAWRLGTVVFGVLFLWLVFGGVRLFLRPNDPFGGWHGLLSRLVSAVFLLLLYWRWWLRRRPWFAAQSGTIPNGGPASGESKAADAPPSAS